MLSESFFEYNNSQVTLSQGNHKEWFKLNPRGQLLQKIENSGLISNYAYDSLGKRRDVQLFFQDSVHPVGEFKYLYDDKGMLTEIKSLDKGKPGFHYASMKYKYDNKGNIIQESNFYPNNKLAYSDFYTYDDKNNIESRSRSYLGSDRQPTPQGQNDSAYNRTYSYDYDAKGNWIRRIDYYNNKPLFIVERAINYGRLDKDFIVNGYASEQEAPDQYSSQKEAQFPGGIMAWQQFLVKNLKTDIPKLNGAPAGQYSIVISFLINKDGTVTEAKCVSAPHPDFGCVEEALRVIRLSPSWIPAEKNGQKVFYREKQRINFRVDRQVKSDQ
ncbi:YD repeat-containing protein [Arachidicoccus rhizosphaerae]|uniref:YD repeat-containing protein n=1 Tax=Arachidicoccus rhizosphaerae TaxID=551991 RepID=A0A1H4ADW7_9BACT|nr:energy transducer TonB [Arachidicoccus rhizosphaerae]SEA34195.1 YD repeat-containing protein [Arachidicoccus rhizosphaerae]